jgi:hypothetical protein
MNEKNICKNCKYKGYRFDYVPEYFNVPPSFPSQLRHSYCKKYGDWLAVFDLDSLVKTECEGFSKKKEK